MKLHLVGMGTRVVWDSDILEASPGGVTLSLILLDGSGSMKRLWPDVMDATSAFIQTVQGSPAAGSTALGLWTFDQGTHVVLPFHKATGVRVLPTIPSAQGKTRLYGTILDAIHMLRQIDDAMEEAGEPLKIILTVITDGKDEPDGNKTPDAETLLKLQAAVDIARLRRFELQLFGIGIDAGDLARTIRFPDDDTRAITVGRTRDGIHQTMSSVARSTILTSLLGDRPSPSPPPPAR